MGSRDPVYKSRVVRLFGWFVASAVVVAFAAIQIVSSIALRSAAQSASWPTFVSQALGAKIDALDPSVPVPPALRLVFARRALAAHDVARASAEGRRLGSSRDRYALVAGIAEAHGDTVGATNDYLAAGDVAGLDGLVERLAARGRFREALRLQRAIVARLSNDRTQQDALAAAAFSLGLLEERQAYALAVGAPERHAHELLARDAYALAAKLSPLSGRYLLALGNQQLNVFDIAGAVATFDLARSVDPTNAGPLLGLGDAAARRGERDVARRYLARARAIEPASAAAERLAREIGE